MANFNFDLMTPPADVIETREFSDSHQPDHPPVSITLQSVADYSEVLRIQAMSRANVEVFGQPHSIPIMLSRKRIRITPELCFAIATLQCLENPPEGTKRSTFQDWAKMNAAMPNAFGEVIDWASQIYLGASKRSTGKSAQRGKKAQVPNDSAAPGEGSSATPPNTTPPAIPKLSGEVTPSLLEPSASSDSSRPKSTRKPRSQKISPISATDS